MPCKHEGGSDPCARNSNRDCIVRKGQRDTWKSSTSFKGRDLGKVTAAGELLVRYDLLKRGFEVTVPASPTARHDLHAEFPSVGWKGVQVKVGVRGENGTIRLARGRKGIESPILALVWIPNNTIVYKDGTEPVPQELIDGCL